MLRTFFAKRTHISKSKFIDFKLLLKCTLQRKSYSEYYGLRQNRIVLGNPNWGLNLKKEFQLDYLVSKGLASEHKILDYGCGAASAGRYFIEFLNNGNYVGVDVSTEAIKQAKLRMVKFGLVEKKPSFNSFVFPDLGFLKKEKFDYVWAQSVLTHMSPKDIKILFAKIKTILRVNGLFFCTFGLSKKITHINFKDWGYPLSFFEEICKKNSLSVELQSDWIHPDDPNGTDKILMIRTHN